MNGSPPARKPRPLLITAAVLLLLLPVYIGAFYANLAGGRIMYISPPITALSPPISDTLIQVREVPRYRIAQQASEAIFWPADKLDALLRPDRYGGAQGPVSQWRDEWW